MYSEPHEIKVLETMVASQGLTEVLEQLIAACDGQAWSIRRFRMGPLSVSVSSDKWERRALLWERCAGRLRDTAGSPAVRELRRQLREDTHG